jgi:hypothetical protein
MVHAYILVSVRDSDMVRGRVSITADLWQLRAILAIFEVAAPSLYSARHPVLLFSSHLQDEI